METIKNRGYVEKLYVLLGASIFIHYVLLVLICLLILIEIFVSGEYKKILKNKSLMIVETVLGFSIIMSLFYKNYYGYEKYFNKVLILKDVKNFTYTIEELAYHTEMYEFLNELELEAFTRVFYRNKKLNKLYIFDANYSVTIIEFSKKMNWRNQKR